MSEHPVRIESQNFLLNVLDGALFISSTAFISGQTVLPAMVARLGGDNIAVGALGVFLWVGLFLPQIFAARYVETLPWKKPWSVGFGAAQRSVVLLMGIVILLLGDSHPAAALWTFLGLFLLNQVLTGVATPGWFDLFAKVTPPDKRGRLIGVRTSLGGGGAFLCGFVLIALLGSLTFPLSFAFAFFCAFALQTISIVVQSRLVEEVPSKVTERKPVFAFLRQVPAVLRGNVEFTRFLVASIFLVLSMMPAGFFTVSALSRFQADESVAGEFTLVMVAVLVVSALAIGFIADRYGNKTALIFAASGMLCASLWALVAPTLTWFKLVFVFMGINLGTELMMRYNMAIDYGPVEQRSTYIGLMNTVLAPFYFSGILGGWLSDMFGYPAVFGVGALSSIVGIVLLVVNVRDPRSLQTVDPI